jgi:hypothetical protein
VTRFERALVGSFALALTLRLAAAITGGPILSPDSAGLIAAGAALRGSILAADEIVRTRPPLYSLLIAIEVSPQLVVITQAIASAFCAPLLGFATIRHFGARAALVAAFAAAIMPEFIQWTPYVLTDVLALAILSLAIERTSAALAHGRLRDDLLAGVVAALSVLTRSAYIAALLVLGVFSLVRARRAALHLATFALGVALILTLPIVRNAAAVGIPEIYEGRGWETLWEGTMWNEVGRGTGGVDIIFPPSLETMTSAQQTEYFRSEVVKAYTERPLQMAGLALKKALWYVLPFYPEWSIAHKAANALTVIPTYLLATWGIWSRRRVAFSWLLVLLAGSFVGTAMLTVVDYDARYQLPFVLALLPLAGAGADAAWTRVYRFLFAPRSATSTFARSSMSNDSPQSPQ